MAFRIQLWGCIIILYATVTDAIKSEERCKPKEPSPAHADLCFGPIIPVYPRDGEIPKFVLQNVNLSEYAAHICNGCKNGDKNAILCQCDGTSGQTFEMHTNAIVNVPGKDGELWAMEINGSSEGSAIIMRKFEGRCSQQWFFESDGSIRNANGLFLDVKAKEGCASHLGAFLHGSTNCMHHKWAKRFF